MTQVFALEQVFFKTYECFMLLRYYSDIKNNFPKRFSKVFKWQNDFMQK